MMKFKEVFVVQVVTNKMFQRMSFKCFIDHATVQSDNEDGVD